MSGGLFTRAVGREIGRELGVEEARGLQARHGELYRELLPERRALPGAAEPEPDLFLECARRLGAPADECFVVGDAVWDLLAARRARTLSIGLLSGGYGDDELTRAGAFRVYRDAAELHASLDELGVEA
jgi:phosphoglycolate phosphatase-like HAD superfamily hydrolase